MNDNIASFKEILEALSAPLGLAAFGGIARACRFGVKSWRQFCGSIVVSAFTGVVVHLLLLESSLSTSLQAAIVAASGYSGGAILDAMATAMIQHIEQIPGKIQGDKNAQEKH